MCQLGILRNPQKCKNKIFFKNMDPRMENPLIVYKSYVIPFLLRNELLMKFLILTSTFLELFKGVLA